MTWLLAIPAALAAGLLFFIMLSRQNPAYLRGLRDHVAYYFAPFGPQLMVLVKRLDSSVALYYDVVVEASERGHIIQTEDGSTYVSRTDPRRGELVALVDARGPVGVPSPFGYTWRVLAGWMVSSIVLWIAFVNTFLDAIIRGVQPGAVEWLMFMALVLDLFYVFGIIMPRLYTPSVHMTGLVEAGFNPPYTVVVPSCSPWDTTPVDQCVNMLGGRIGIMVPQSLKELLEELRKEHGSYTLAAAIAAKLDEGVRARKTITELKRRMFVETEAAKALIRAEGWKYLFHLTLPRALLLLLVFALGLALGLALGGDYVITTQPPATLPSPQAPPATGYHAPQAPPITEVIGNTTETITPAEMPPPPTG